VRGLDDVRVGDEVALAVDEPAGAGLDERRGRTVTVPRPQFSVTSPRTSAVTSATGGLGEQDGLPAR